VNMMPKFCDEIFTIGKIFSPLTYELIGNNDKSRGWHHIFNLKKYNTRNPDPVLPIAKTYDHDKVEIIDTELEINVNFCNFSIMADDVEMLISNYEKFTVDCTKARIPKIAENKRKEIEVTEVESPLN